MHNSLFNSMDFTELGKVSDEWTDFVRNAPALGHSKLVPGMDPVAARALVESSRARPSDADLSAKGLNVRTFTWTDPTTTQKLQFRLFMPPEAAANPTQVFPLYLYFHGGGFLFGSIDSDTADCARISTSSSIMVLSANYRHTDTHTFPSQHDDAWSALQFVLSSPPELTQVDPTRILVAGASAGANLALVTALRAGAEVWSFSPLSSPIRLSSLNPRPDPNTQPGR
ncbi:hypothetical protein G7Z17_g7588 [Cylindrodendrum hubeiense]|uniref:Alpha/beta hydrolase fold-3 domain-containing protein n=1 Tax=Cylindrodendrum hubeiense TaxID=595255 RepID=A0A9P5H2R8_9HYPO|nr:hypothetical protein G7Z17_g7588 [Cylindrodendrum hubeiense]